MTVTVPTAPPLLPLSDNRAFLLHQNDVARLREKVDAIESQGESQVQENRRNLVKEILGYEDDLERFIGLQWEKERQRLSTLQTSDGGQSESLRDSAGPAHGSGVQQPEAGQFSAFRFSLLFL